MPINKSIEATEEMIDAGFEVLKVSGIADEYLEADRLLVVEIFQAMVSRSQHQDDLGVQGRTSQEGY
jgi:hypothetical protein